MSTVNMEVVATLLHKRDELIRSRETKSGAGARAGITSKIGDLQLDLILAGAVPGTADQVKSGDAHFTEWVNPTAVRSSLLAITEDSLVSDIADAYRAMTDPALNRGIDAVIHAADLRITDRLKKSDIRGYAVPDPRVKDDGSSARVWVKSDDGTFTLGDRPAPAPTAPTAPAGKGPRK